MTHRIWREFQSLNDSGTKRGGRPNSANDSPVGPPVKREEPNFKVSGALAADQNTFKGVVLKYSEPAEARRPKERYRLYVFKGKEQIDMLHIHRQSAFLIGRERRVADIPVDHPSCSSQHAAIQYRQIVETDPLGQATRTVKPYLIDLDSSNGTYINGSQVPPSRYVELKVGDSIKFGYSSRDYVLMCEDMVEDD
ncbi:SMAD/FHA domain-containing protein [Powellomyces hirtus]|nr:SMAD/FHA domain-containing protein [Powellomyces hirtus]